jgi:hypothetical protein
LLWPKPLDLRLERGFDRPVRRLNGGHARPGIGDKASLSDALDLRTLLREFDRLDSTWGQAMPRPYSVDLRVRVIGDISTGASRREAAERYGVSPSVVVLWAAPALPGAFTHSITSLASASNLSGISRPSALAVLRLMIISNLVGTSTGRSAGFVPLRILSTK